MEIDLAELLAIFLETLVYGVFLTLFIVTTVAMFMPSQNPAHIRQRWFVIPVAGVMLFLATFHLVIDFVRIVNAFVKEVHQPGGSIGYYGDIAQPLHVMKTAVYVTQTAVGDSVLIWRYYVVYGKKIWFAVPLILLMFGDAVTGYVVCWQFSRASPDSTVFSTAASWITTFFVLTFCINIICTAAIVFRILFSVRGMITSGRGNVVPAMVVIVESGALYAGSVLALLVSYLAGSNGQFPALDVVTPLVGVVFSLIVLQIRFRVGHDSHSPNAVLSSSGGVTTRPRPRGGTRRTSRGEADDFSYPLRSVTVKITEETEVHGDSDYGEDPIKTLAVEDKEAVQRTGEKTHVVIGRPGRRSLDSD
ncbi:hypothetical protein OF83DRAFT_934320 [Amylostereum chailletii]|nr:hypothetical protein OF83DRAFT_934320 [Amylostereum chailletii]